ncbi:MAG: hypothetical protein E7675_04875 [Ruminococcaceae bacterium]|nr:hypothetical protein [Oscillospiraceae bacterium]
MEKKLSEIFDQATPNELEQFSKELEFFELENEILSSVKNKVYAKTKLEKCYQKTPKNQKKGRIDSMKTEKKFTKVYKPLLASAACLAMLFGIFAGYSAFTNKPTTTPTTPTNTTVSTIKPSTTPSDTFTENNIIATTVTLDVNPSIEIQASEDEIVQKVVALNKDAEIIIDGLKFDGNSLEVTVNTLVGAMIENGYINETTNTLLLSVDSKNEDVGNAIKDKLSAEVTDLINTDAIHGSVISQTVSADDEELSALASQYGITVGKAKLIQTIMKINPDEEFSYYAELNITELNKIMNTSVDDNKDNNSYIGEEKALEIALDKLDLTLNDLDFKPTIELVASRGDICYCITVSKTDNNSSKTYVIYVDAFTGKMHGEDVTEPNFSIEEAWGFVCDEIGSDAENANLTEQRFNGMDTTLPMTYVFVYEIGNSEYSALVDAMNGVVIRITEI